MSDPRDTHGGAPPVADPLANRPADSLADRPADPLADEIEVRAAELRALIKAAPAPTEYGPPPGWLELRERRRRRVLLAAGGLLMAAGALTFVLIMTGISLLGVAIFAPGVLLLALATGWRPFYWVYLPGLALAGMGLGMIVDRAVGSPMILSAVGLGGGLILAWLIRRVQVGWAHLWPLVFGLFFAGFGVLAGFDHPWSVVAHVWPLLLVVVGLVFVVRAVLPSRRLGEPPGRR